MRRTMDDKVQRMSELLNTDGIQNDKKLMKELTKIIFDIFQKVADHLTEMDYIDDYMYEYDSDYFENKKYMGKFRFCSNKEKNVYIYMDIVQIKIDDRIIPSMDFEVYGDAEANEELACEFISPSKLLDFSELINRIDEYLKPFEARLKAC